MAVPIGPLILEPIFQERVWGVQKLPGFYARPATGKPVGEAWLTADTCVAASGPLRGTALAEIARRSPAAFGGNEFPLLVKMLFPREKLSVQVHPNDEQARALGHARGKTECWYVLSAEPGAQVALGFREPLTLDQVRSAIDAQTLEDKLCYLPVKAGDMVYVDAGTVHAIGPGMVVLETQQYSDVTYRLYDYGRPRDLHVEDGLAVSRTSTRAGLVTPIAMDGFVRLVASEYFVVDRFALGGGASAVAAPAGEAALGNPATLQMLVALQDGCAVASASGVTDLPPGRVVVLPAEGVEYSLRGAGDVVRIGLP